MKQTENKLLVYHNFRHAMGGVQKRNAINANTTKRFQVDNSVTF
jgi:hypothetical protein